MAKKATNIDEMLADYKNGMSMRDVALKHHISRDRFSKIVKENGLEVKARTFIEYNKPVEERKNDFIEKAKKVHGGKYDYSKVEYKNARENVCIVCPEHGEFWQSPYSHLTGRGCPLCAHNGKVYKPVGHWNIKENCFAEAKKYRNKYELMRKCQGCYNGLVRNGWLDEAASLFYDNGVILYRDFNEPVHFVYVYEYEQTKSFYVGRTSNLRRRDRQHRNGYKHTDGSTTYDVVYTHAQENGLGIPEPKVLEEKLTAVESQEKEDYWKRFYIEKGWNALNKAVTGVNKGSLGAALKWTYDACKDEASKYKSRAEFRRFNQSAYNSCVKNEWIDEFFEKKKFPDGYWDIKENVLNAAKQCKGARDLIKKFGGAYNSAKKYNWIELLEYGKEENT